jgi:dynein heavy chain 1
MVADQNEAQKRKEEAEKMSVAVERQQVAIAERKQKAQSDLDEAEPALNSAKNSVKGIKKKDLDEIRNLGRPPPNVVLTLECVAIMLGETSVDWADVRKLLAKSDFIPSILSFDGKRVHFDDVPPLPPSLPNSRPRFCSRQADI